MCGRSLGTDVISRSWPLVLGRLAHRDASRSGLGPRLTRRRCLCSVVVGHSGSRRSAVCFASGPDTYPALDVDSLLHLPRARTGPAHLRSSTRTAVNSNPATSSSSTKNRAVTSIFGTHAGGGAARQSPDALDVRQVNRQRPLGCGHASRYPRIVDCCRDLPQIATTVLA